MTTPLTIALPDELVHKLQAQAKQQNTSIEGVVVQVLSETANRTLTQVTNTPNLTELITSANQLLVAEMFSCIRAAKLAGQTSAEVPAIPITLKITEDMKRYGIIADVQASEMHPETWLLLRFHPSGHEEQSQLERVQQSQVQLAQAGSDRPPAVENGLNAEELPPELAQIVQDLQQDDPTIRIHALDALGELYREPTQSGE